MAEKHECPLCGSETYIFEIGLLEGLVKFAYKNKWDIVASDYNRPPIESCVKGKKHIWDGRKISGINFRRCLHCNIIQRRLYFPYFVDVPLQIEMEEWKGYEQSSIHDLLPGQKIDFWEH